MQLDLDGLINSIKTAASTEGGNGLRKLHMSFIDNQGIATFVPMYSKVLNNFFLEESKVKEFKGENPRLENGGWYKLLAKKSYGELSEADSELYDEISALWNSVFGTEELGWDTIRERTYTVFFGVMVSLMAANKKANKLQNKPAMLIYPSISPMKGLMEAIKQKQATSRTGNQWLHTYLKMGTEDRRGCLQTSFTKKEGDGIGYDCTVSFTLHSEDEPVFPDEWKITPEMGEMFDDPRRELLGWMVDEDYEDDHGNMIQPPYWNREIMTQYRDLLIRTLRNIKIGWGEEVEPLPEAQAPVAGVQATPTQAPVGNTPTQAPVEDMPASLDDTPRRESQF